MTSRLPAGVAGRPFALLARACLLCLLAGLAGNPRASALPQAAANTFMVDTLYDANNASALDINPGDGICLASIGACTMRAALMETNALSGPQTIAFSITGQLLLKATLPHVAKALIISGPGSDLLTLDGNATVQVLVIDPAVTLDISNLRISGGRTTGNGGGMYSNGGTITVTNMLFTGNQSGPGWAGGALASLGGFASIRDSTFFNNSSATIGGAVYSHGPMIITQSTFWQNASAASGSAVFNDSGYLVVANSSFVANTLDTAQGSGALATGGAATTYLTNSTFANNTGGAINSNLIYLRNTILAGSIGAGNCGGLQQNGGGNLDDGTSCFWQAPANGSVNSVNPLLDLTGYAGGAVPLQAGSPAINTGITATCVAAVGDPNYGAGGMDGRGWRRPVGAGCEKGAFEYQAPPTFLPMLVR
jgi:predicted outer membrane repeat protein